MNDMNAEALLRLRSENAELRAHLKEAHALGADFKKGWDEAAAGWRAALLQIDEIKRRLKGTIEMPIEPCCKRLLQATLDGIDNVATSGKRNYENAVCMNCIRPDRSCEEHGKPVGESR